MIDILNTQPQSPYLFRHYTGSQWLTAFLQIVDVIVQLMNIQIQSIQLFANDMFVKYFLASCAISFAAFGSFIPPDIPHIYIYIYTARLKKNCQ